MHRDALFDVRLQFRVNLYLHINLEKTIPVVHAITLQLASSLNLKAYTCMIANCRHGVINCFTTFTELYQGLIDSKEKRAYNVVPIKIQTEAKNSNKLCIIYATKCSYIKILKIVLFYCRILLSLKENTEVTCPLIIWSL